MNGRIKTLYFEKHLITKNETEFTFVVNQKPNKVGIDPYHKLIDRHTDDNTKKAVLKDDDKDEEAI